MRVFVTGASGWIGSALVPELIGAGHEVTGLARSDASAAALTGAGARVHRGDLDDPGGLRGAAGASDGVIHLAFSADMMRSGDFQGAVDADRRAVEALGEALTGSDRPLVIASATVVLAPGRAGTEQDAPGLDPAAAGTPRPRSVLRVTREPRASSATAPAGGPPCTGSMRHTCSAWLWRRHRRDRRCTRSRTRVCRPAPSP